MNSIVFTCQEQSYDLCRRELQAIFPTGLRNWLVPGVGIWQTGTLFPQAAETVRRAAPIFLRHIYPLELEAAIPAEGLTAELIAKWFAPFIPRIRDDGPFSAQFRALDEETGVHRHEWMAAVSEYLVSQGGVLQVEDPALALSAVTYKNMIYAGLSHAAGNLSSWPGGMRRFAHWHGQSSRAAFKLLEAEETFGLEFCPGQKALDLGASPGGWSQVLLDRGLLVTAVDPADMAEGLRKRPGLRHYQGLAQAFLREDADREGNPVQYDWIVNDMRMDAVASARLMAEMVGKMSPGGGGVITLKLPKEKALGAMNRALAELAKGFEVMWVKQLFHNRSEVMAVVKGGKK